MNIVELLKKEKFKYDTTKTHQEVLEITNIRKLFSKLEDSEIKKLSLDSQIDFINCINICENVVNKLMLDYIKVDNALIRLVEVYEDLIKKHNLPDNYDKHFNNKCKK
jgi:hypothetical protein